MAGNDNFLQQIFQKQKQSFTGWSTCCKIVVLSNHLTLGKIPTIVIFQ